MTTLRCCRICRKPLGLRRSAQGLLLHPACRRSLDRDQLEDIIEQTRQILERCKQRSRNQEEDPLFGAAVQQAQELLLDLQRLRGYLAPAPHERSHNEI